MIPIYKLKRLSEVELQLLHLTCKDIVEKYQTDHAITWIQPAALKDRLLKIALELKPENEYIVKNIIEKLLNPQYRDDVSVPTSTQTLSGVECLSGAQLQNDEKLLNSSYEGSSSNT